MDKTRVGDIYVVHDHVDWKMPGGERHFRVCTVRITDPNGEGFAKVNVGKWDGIAFVPTGYHYFVALLAGVPSEGSEWVANVLVEAPEEK